MKHARCGTCVTRAPRASPVGGVQAAQPGAAIAGQRFVQALDKPLARLDEEFMPLPVAAGIAYAEIIGSTQLQASEDVPLVGIALSTVAPIYRTTRPDGLVRLSLAEIDQRLLLPLRSKNGQPALDDLRIRRSDLRPAIAAPKEARAAFG